MLPKSQRLNLSNDFKWVATGVRVETKFTTLFIKSGDNLSPRVGIAVSSKKFKNATDRNRVRRLISQAFQSTYYQLPTNVNIVALPKSGVVKVKSSEVLLDLEEGLKKAGVIPSD